MVAFGDADKDVWLTEFGYSTTSQDGGVSAATQATFLRKAYRYVERFPWVKTLFWYAARNSPFYEDADTYEGRFGLATTDWRLKPSYGALRAYALDLPVGRVVLRKSAQQPLQAWGRPAARVTLRGRVALGGDPVAARTLPQVVVVQRRTSRGWVRRRPPARRGDRRLPSEPRRARSPRPLPRRRRHRRPASGVSRPAHPARLSWRGARSSN